MSNVDSIKRMQSVEKLIADKMMVVDAKNFHVSMLSELFDNYNERQKINFCQNILNYCKIQNSYNQISEKSDTVLLISTKDKDNEVAPFAYFKNGAIEYIENSDVIRNFDTRNLKRFYKLFKRVGILIIIIITLLFIIL